jgi:NAD(P)-dependent dehydrogenase (short-subunit alcohol dehydrogenase family)
MCDGLRVGDMRNRKTILITGTSSGIGKVTAQYFAERGWNVAATVRRREDFFLGKDAPHDEKDFPHARNFMLDVTQDDQCEKTIDDVIKTFGRLDALVNNAGLAIRGAFEESSRENIEDQLQTNLYGPMRMTKYILPHFRRQRHGIILTVSTMGGRVGIPFYSVHAASKFAVEGFFESIRFELHPFNILIKLVEPGSYKTQIHTKSDKYAKVRIGNEYQPYLEKYEAGVQQYEVRRRDPIEVAEMIWDAVSDDKDQLRYIVGDDAIHMEKMRKEMSDDQIFAMIGKIFQK